MHLDSYLSTAEKIQHLRAATRSTLIFLSQQLSTKFDLPRKSRSLEYPNWSSWTTSLLASSRASITHGFCDEGFLQLALSCLAFQFQTASSTGRACTSPGIRIS